MNPLYRMVTGGAERHSETPGQQGMQMGQMGQPTDMNAAMAQLKANPAEILGRAGFSVPAGMTGDPHAMVMHLIQSGQVGNPMMRMIQPMLSRLMGR